ncbi:MAG: hypothetical protein QM655_01810 [Nocardioidaceae bacterium]
MTRRRRDRDEKLLAEVRELLRAAGVEPPDSTVAPDAHLGPIPPDLEAELTEQAEADLARFHQRASKPQPRPKSARFRLRLVPLGLAFVAFVLIAVSVAIIAPWQEGHSPNTHYQQALPPAANGGRTPPMANFQLVSSDTTPLQGENPDDALERLATLASQQPPAGGEGDIQKVVMSSWWLSTEPASGRSPAVSVLLPNIVENYLLPDGQLRAVQRTGEPLDPYGRVRAPLVAPDSSQVTDDTFDGPEAGPDYPSTLPLDPDKLIRSLVPEPAECPRLAGCLAQQIANLNQTYALPPDLVGALWRTLEAQPGVTYLGRTEDRLGRSSVAFAVPAQDRRRQFILYADPTTGSYHASEQILVTDDKSLALKAPAVVDFTAIVESTWIKASDLP